MEGEQDYKSFHSARLSCLPDIITALLVNTVIGQVHELILDMLCVVLILHSGKPTKGKRACFFSTWKGWRK